MYHLASLLVLWSAVLLGSRKNNSVDDATAKTQSTKGGCDDTNGQDTQGEAGRVTLPPGLTATLRTGRCHHRAGCRHLQGKVTRYEACKDCSAVVD